MDIKRLAQATIEDKFSRKNVRDHIMNEIYDMDESYEPKLMAAVEAIWDFIGKSYWPSKNVRMKHLMKLELLPVDIVAEILVIILPLKGAQTIQSISGQLAGKLGYADIFDGVKTAAELITVVCHADLYDIIPPRMSETGSAMVVSKVALPESVMQYIASTKYLPPMICKPNIIKGNWDSPHITIEGNGVLLKGNTHDGKMPLKAINIRNQIALSLDEHMLQYEEEPKNKLDTPEKIVAFNRMKAASRVVYHDLMEAGNEFYLTHKGDERVRLYTQGYHCSYQSSEFKKSLINLAHKELVV